MYLYLHVTLFFGSTPLLIPKNARSVVEEPLFSQINLVLTLQKMRWLKYGVGMLTATLLSCYGAATPVPTTETPSLEEIARRYTKRTAGGVHLPIVRQVTEASELRKRGKLTSAIGLGDFEDV